MEEKKFEYVENKMEISMYKLLIIGMLGVIIAVGLGLFVGNLLGRAQSLNDIGVTTPNYCSFDKVGGKITVSCNELDMTADKMCDVLSGPLKEKIRILVVSEASKTRD